MNRKLERDLTSELVLSCRPTLLAAFLLAGISLQPAAPAASAYYLDNRWSTTASGSLGTQGSPVKLTWSIVPDGTSGGGVFATSSLISFLDATFGSAAGTDLTKRPWFTYFSQSFDRWSQLTGATFSYESHDNMATFNSAVGGIGIRGDIRIAGANIDGAGGTLARTYYPNSGDMQIDTSDGAAFAMAASNHLEFRNVLMHETGHALGLKHIDSSTNEFLMHGTISTDFDGPQIDDILAAQYFYGDALEKTNSGQGNDTPVLATSLGTIAVGGSKSIGTAAANQIVNATATDFVSIDSNTDVDYFSFSVTGPTRLSATLTPEGGTYMERPDTPGSSESLFNASAQSDLTLAIFGSNGTTQLAVSNAVGAGVVDALNNVSLAAAGTYYARVTGVAAAAQLYQLQLSVAAPLPAGDYNHNGVVDAADYAVWRDSLGQTGTGLAADGNANGQIDAGDYTTWKTHFGTTSGSGALGGEVPEPATAFLAAVGSLAVLAGRPGSAANRR
jgi:serralysin